VLKPLAAKLNYPYKVFDVNEYPALLAALKEVKVVVNAADHFNLLPGKSLKPVCKPALIT
jgi:hypothetical protein